MAITETVPEWTLADRLIKARKVAGLSQENMADYLGVSVAAISKFERGYPVRDSYVRSWATRCGVPVTWLAPELLPIPPARTPKVRRPKSGPPNPAPPKHGETGLPSDTCDYPENRYVPSRRPGSRPRIPA